MQDDEKYKKIKEELDRFHRQRNKNYKMENEISKESTKDLETYLNLKNKLILNKLDLKNSKKSNPIDYDKNPITIKDFNTIFDFIICSLIYIIGSALLLFWNPGNTGQLSINAQVFVILPMMLFPSIMPYIKYGNKRFIILENDNIKFMQKDKIIEMINLNSKFELYKTFENYYHKSQEPKTLDRAFGWLFRPIDICFLVVSKFFYHIVKGGSYRLFDSVIIFQDDKIINILINSNEEYEKIRTFFMSKFDIDINSAEKYISKIPYSDENID